MATRLGQMGMDALDALFVPGAPTVQLGPYLAPTEPSAAFQCWGDAREPKDAAYRVVVHRCSTDESVFLSEDLSAGLVYFSHQLLDGAALSRLRLLTASEQAFNDKLTFDGTARETTRFRCTTGNVRTATMTFRAEVCARRLKSLYGLYEAVMRATPLGATAQSLVTTLTMSGVRFDLIQRTVARYLASITLVTGGRGMSWIEVVDASGRVVARRAAEGVPCTVGSALDNTLLIEGPEVAPYHARIDREADGRLTVTVLGQSSGLQRPGAPERAMSLALTPSAPVAVGGASSGSWMTRLATCRWESSGPSRAGGSSYRAGRSSGAPPRSSRSAVRRSATSRCRGRSGR